MDAIFDADLHCPLCEYNLRGLAEPRCPECGFAFSWDELRAAGRGQHAWLFEHGRRRNLRTLWTTWWRNRFPWAFWREVSPVNPVRAGRLVAYWAIVAAVAVALLSSPLPHGMVVEWNDAASRRFISSVRPLPTFSWDWIYNQAMATMQRVREARFSPGVLGPPLMVVLWPWLTVAALMVFRISMRRARINPAHVLRAALYGCDFGLSAVAFVVLFVPFASVWFWQARGDVPLIWLAIACGVLATFRMTFAFRHYLRFHLPLLTVLASQVLVALAVTSALALWGDLSPLFR